MIKPKPIPKKGKKPIQKNQRTIQSNDILPPKIDFFHNRSVLLVIILIITFIAFLPSLSNQFIKAWDDGAYVTDNSMITHLNWDSIKGFFTTQKNGTYVPLPLLSWALEFKFFGLNPFPYHLNNLLLHLLCTSLVFYFLILLRIPVLYAAFGALLFGIHPMRVESVAWVTERKDLLFSVFYLGSLITYVKYILVKNKRPIFFLLTLFLFVLSLFSKIQAVSLPLSFFLVDYWFARRLKWNILWEKIPFLLLSLGFGLTGYFILQHTQVIEIHDKFNLLTRILLGLFSLSAYIVKFIVPLNLSILYPYPVDPGESLPILYWLNPVFLIALAVLIYITARKTKAVVFGFLFYLFNVMFLLQFVRAGQAYQADRFTYVAYIGLFFLAVWAAHKYATRNKSSQWMIAGLAIVFTVFFFSATYARCKDWKDNITLWNDVIEKFPQKIPTAYYNLGLAYEKLGQWDKAIASYTGAIQIRPKYTDAYSNRGIAYKNHGQLDKAIDDYSKAIALDPEYVKGYYNRGTAYYLLRQFNQAIADFSKAIALNPDHTKAYNNRGIVYNDLGRWDMAVADFSKAIEIDPNYKDAYANRGISYGRIGQWGKAITDYSSVIAISPDASDAYNNRGIVYSSVGQWDKAIADYSKAIELDPNSRDALSNRGLSYGHLGQWEKAIADFSRTIELDPKYINGYNNLGNAYFTLGQWDKAIAQYSRAIEIDPSNKNAFYNREVAYKRSGIKK